MRELDEIIAECVEFSEFYLSPGDQRLAFGRIVRRLTEARLEKRGYPMGYRPDA